LTTVGVDTTELYHVLSERKHGQTQPPLYADMLCTLCKQLKKVSILNGYYNIH